MPLCSGPASGGAPLLPTLGALAVKGWRELLARQSDLVAWCAWSAHVTRVRRRACRCSCRRTRLREWQ